MIETWVFAAVQFVSYWHDSDIPRRPRNVRYRLHLGRQMLFISISESGPITDVSEAVEGKCSSAPPVPAEPALLVVKRGHTREPRVRVAQLAEMSHARHERQPRA